MTRMLDYDDEPQDAGDDGAVHFGDYRRQEVWVRSGANGGLREEPHRRQEAGRPVRGAHHRRTRLRPA